MSDETRKPWQTPAVIRSTVEDNTILDHSACAISVGDEAAYQDGLAAGLRKEQTGYSIPAAHGEAWIEGYLASGRMLALKEGETVPLFRSIHLPVPPEVRAEPFVDFMKKDALERYGVNDVSTVTDWGRSILGQMLDHAQGFHPMSGTEPKPIALSTDTRKHEAMPATAFKRWEDGRL